MSALTFLLWQWIICEVMIFSLTGDADCIRNGRLMIEKVINDEQARRNQQAHHSRGNFLWESYKQYRVSISKFIFFG